MGFDRSSGKWSQRLILACVIAAALTALWSRWAALALAGCGLGIGAPIWMGKSWSDFLKPFGQMITRLFRARKTRFETIEEADENGQPGQTEPIAHRPCSPHTWSLPTRALEALEENACRPQNSIRLAVDGSAAGPEREKPLFREEAEAVIDLSSVLGNLKKRYSGKRAAGRVLAPESPSPKEHPVTTDIEEIRSRLRGAYGKRLPEGVKRSSSDPQGKSPRSSTFGNSNEFNQAPASRLLMPTESLRKRAKPVGEATPPQRSFYEQHSSREAASFVPARSPQDKVSGKIVDDAMAQMNARSGSPSSLANNGPKQWDDGLRTPIPDVAVDPPVDVLHPAEMDLRKAEEVCTPTHPCKAIVKAGELQILPTPPERDTRILPAEKPAPPEPESPLFYPAGDGPATGGARASAAQGSAGNALRPEFHGKACLPPLSLLHPAYSAVAPMSQDDLIEGGILIEDKLAEFKVKVSVQDAYAGPVITRYEVQPAVGVRGGQVVSLMKDLARALGVASIRVIETIPGKTCMGLELPNPRRQMIRLSEVLSSEVFQSHDSKLAMALGKDITGEPVAADLAKAPHMLVAGTTGSGKSVGINAMILSLLYRTTPEEVRFVMIDPKMLELSIYDGIPHLLAPVVTDMKLAANALTWCVVEMERRYRLMSALKVRNLAGYNQKVLEALEAGEPLIDSESLMPEDSPAPLSPLPYIVVVVDELADLMMVSGKKIEELIARLAQKARAAGIHLILATQRPSVDVITGLIKANIPTRIAFQVSSKIDSRTILDQMGAECLLGQGDMLYLPPGTGYPQRVHGAFVADEEVQAVAEYLKQFGEPDYVEGVLSGATDSEEGGAETERFGEDSDPLYDDAVAFVINSRRASISAVQRQLRIGYNRAARLVEQMEASGLVSPMESNGNRTVLVPPRQE